MGGMGDVTKAMESAEGKSPPAAELEPASVQLDLDWISPKGEHIKGSLRVWILSGDERQLTGNTAALFAKTQTWEALPESTRERYFGVAWIGNFLRAKDQDQAIVDALTKWLPVDDVLFDTLWGEVWQHHNRYFPRHRGKGADGTQVPRVQVAPRRPAPTAAQRARSVQVGPTP